MPTSKTIQPKKSIQQLILREQRKQAIPTIVLPALTFVVVMVFLGLPSIPALIVFGVFYVLTILGITVGFHRMLTHSSFSAPNWIRQVFSVMGCMAAQGPPTVWIANHRLHHQHSDQDEDPHSPHLENASRLQKLKAFWHAHVTWMLDSPPPSIVKYAPDILRDPVIMTINKHYLRWVIFGLILPGVIVGAITQSFYGFAEGVIWGGLIRLFVVQHVTWCINSVCHVFGSRPWATKDKSRNSFLLGLLALGEGWHNNHHAAPTSARHGFSWWQIDVSYGVIKFLSLVGLAKKVKLADTTRLRSRNDERMNKTKSTEDGNVKVELSTNK